MLELEKNRYSNTELQPPKVRSLIFGRLILIFVLLVAVWWWKNSYLGLASEEFPGGLFILFFVSLALSTAYLLLLKFNGNLIWQVRAQLVIDIFLITFLVWETGDIRSPYIALYVILTGIAGLYLGKFGTIAIAAFSAFCYTLLPFFASLSFIYVISGEQSSSKLLQEIGFNLAAILVVGLLAARFSERRRVDNEIIEAAESFADLHVLHARIVESINSGLITTDLDGKIYTFNRAAEEISGLKADETIGSSIFKFFADDIQNQVGICMASVPGGEFIPRHFEAKILSDSTAQKHVAVACSVSPLVGKNGLVTGLLITFQDISGIKAMEESLRRSDRLAAVGRMAAGLAHEIRNPLGSMSSALQFLQERTKPETDEASLIGVVLKESDRLNRIISNFLTYARPKPESLPAAALGETDVGAAVKDCLVLLRHNPEVNERHHFEVQLPEKPVKITANETQLKQIFWNLSKNSIQAMPRGGSLMVRLKEISGKNVQIVFEDTGRGINPEYLDHLFEPFSETATGTGLGLSIVHKIVSDHKGRIDIQSKVGEGTKVIIELPRAA